jgi:hypothetical protein
MRRCAHHGRTAELTAPNPTPEGHPTMTITTVSPGDEFISAAIRQNSSRHAPGSAATVTDSEISEAFGPGWRAVCSVVRRAAVATPADAARLREAWEETSDGCRAAQAEARDAVFAAWLASRRARISWGAWGALSRADMTIRGDEPAARSRAATMLAARYAAMATMVADLVGHHGLTEEHVEMARAPWVCAFGEID